jgi:hypothetical protein
MIKDPIAESFMKTFKGVYDHIHDLLDAKLV